jgi:hypothetical protein
MSGAALKSSGGHSPAYKCCGKQYRQNENPPERYFLEDLESSNLFSRTLAARADSKAEAIDRRY